MRKTTCLTLLLVACGSSVVCSADHGAASAAPSPTAPARVVPGANVTVKSEETGFNRSTVTNASRLSTAFAELPLGTYTVEVSLTGFKSAIRRRHHAQRRRRALAKTCSSKPGTLSENVTVEVPGGLDQDRRRRSGRASSRASRFASCRSTAATSCSSAR